MNPAQLLLRDAQAIAAAVRAVLMRAV